MNYYNVKIMWKPRDDVASPVISVLLEGVRAADKSMAAGNAMSLLNCNHKSPMWSIIQVTEM